MNIVIFTLLSCLEVSAQDYNQEFLTLCAGDKRSEALPLLVKWEKEKPDDPEMYVAYFNYYYLECKQEIVQLSTEPGEGQQMIIADTGSGETVGYMYSAIHFNDSLFDLVQKYIDEGIAKNPKRLDMYFGKIYTLRDKGLYKEHVEEILKVIDLHRPNASDWLWSNNEKLEEAEETFKSSIQTYNYELFNLEEAAYTEGIEKISNKMIGLYPDDVENYSNLGACSLLKGKWKKALKFFIKANNLNANDVVVLSNIAYTYVLMNKKEKGIEYYKKIIECGGPQDIEFATKKIEELKPVE